jgi:small-conductance mechanosensitive channel
MHSLLSILAIVTVLCIWGPDTASAQSLGSLVPNSETLTDVSSLDEVMKKAAENGISVVVIDPDGRMVAQSGSFDANVVDPAAVEKQGSALMKLQESVLQFREALVDRLSRLPDAYEEVLIILRSASPDGRIFTYFTAFALSMLMFAAGVLVEREIYGKRIAKRFVVARIMGNPQGYSEKMPFLAYRFFIGVGGILVSMGVAYVLGYLIFGLLKDAAIQFTVTLINAGYFLCRLAAGLWRMILSPYLPQYRIPFLGDRQARRLHHWMWTLACLDICAILFGVWIGELGLNYNVYALVASSLSAVIMLANVVLVFANHQIISYALCNGTPTQECSWINRLLLRTWAPVVILYFIFAWIKLTVDLVLGNPSSSPIPLTAGAYGILISIIVVYGVINYMIERGFTRARVIRKMNAKFKQTAASRSPAGGEEATEKAEFDEVEEPRPLRHGMNSYEELARRVSGILAFVAGAYAFFYIWDNHGTQMVESYADQLLDIMVIIFLGYVAYHLFRIWIDTKIAEESPEEEEVELGSEGGASSASRLATLLPLFRNVVLIVVVVTIVLIVLMEVGVNVGPLFAGAGIAGIAIGFGSQALVRDIFAGAFFLFDDAFRKNEYLDVGGVKGTVEKISVRSFQLRHHLGALHTIPFGEIQVMTNYSRDWVMMKLPLRVTYDTDVERVRKLIKKLGQDLLKDPVIGENFILPLKSQGVIEMQDSAMIIRVKFMTKPGDQWLVRKKVYEDIRALFQREGIKFAHREVTVRLADGKVDDLTEEQKREVAAAAHSSIEDDLMDAAAVADSGDDR